MSGWPALPAGFDCAAKTAAARLAAPSVATVVVLAGAVDWLAADAASASPAVVALFCLADGDVDPPVLPVAVEPLVLVRDAAAGRADDAAAAAAVACDVPDAEPVVSDPLVDLAPAGVSPDWPVGVADWDRMEAKPGPWLRSAEPPEVAFPAEAFQVGGAAMASMPMVPSFHCNLFSRNFQAICGGLESPEMFGTSRGTKLPGGKQLLPA